MKGLWILVLALTALFPAMTRAGSLVAQAPAQAQAQTAGAPCYSCGGYRRGSCRYAVCLHVAGRLGSRYCFADNSIFRCATGNGCWVDSGRLCYELALRLDGSFFASSEPDGGSEASPAAASDLRVVGSVRRACADVIVARRYDARAARQVRTATGHIVL